MVDSQVPTLSPIKSPKRRHYYGRPVNEILDAEPVPKKHKANQGSKSIWNCLTILETRQARENMQRTQGSTENSRAACPYDQTAGKEFNCRQPGHQSPALPTTEPLPKTVQFQASRNQPANKARPPDSLVIYCIYADLINFKLLHVSG